jgi:dGTPase
MTTKKRKEPAVLRNRTQMEESEAATLAAYAQKSAESAGRKYSEPRHPFRMAFQRDRARIIHSRAFRRLEYKTQVFLNGTGDHLRTRLTHTIEVASISRTIARALALNEDLAEAIALAHDLGHPPFGHSGEEMLHSLMKEHGGFDHNAQSLRIVELIERKYPKFFGLNLSFEVIEGLKKHQKFYEPMVKGGVKYTSPTLEAQIANLADEITYYSHDIDDGLDFDLISLKQLGQLDVWQEAYERVRSDFPKLAGKELTSFTIRCMIDREVEDVVRTSAECITAAKVRRVEDVRRLKKPLIRYSAGLVKANRNLRKFLYKNLYYHPRIFDVNQRACEMLKNVFDAYVKNPKLLGEAASRRIAQEGLYRTICDYLSGMTDRYLIEEHKRLFLEDGMLNAIGSSQGFGVRHRRE